MNRPKITHLIGSLEVGGAEWVLCNLLAKIDPRDAQMEVISILPEGPLAENIRQCGVPTRSLAMRSRWPNPWAAARLARWLRRDRPDVLVTWLYHSNLLGGVAARLAGRIPVVWNIHSTRLNTHQNKRLTKGVAWLAARQSKRLAERIVFVSESSRQAHEEQGYPAAKSLTIPNGFDLARFRPDAVARRAVRAELQVDESVPLVGLMGRFHPAKDHANFLLAAAELRRRRTGTNAKFLLCGEGLTWDNAALVQLIKSAGVRDACLLLGRRSDMPRLTAALDLTVSSSASEAFPLVVGESMACGVPCVVTDVGDSAALVANTGRVVPPRDSSALAAACDEMLSLSTSALRQLGMAARQRIADHYSIEAIAPRYLKLWTATARGERLADFDSPAPSRDRLTEVNRAA